MSIQPSVNSLQDADKKRLVQRLTYSFLKQEEQVARILEHSMKTPHPVIFSGDFNNTSFSYIYRELRKGKKDAFLEQGNGLGTTFRFDSYPMRIDYILTSKRLDIIGFKTFDQTFSDHHPIKASIGW
jgi:endonuclease/exonuclease/phosphatase family metal-dependent hydrolase